MSIDRVSSSEIISLFDKNNFERAFHILETGGTANFCRFLFRHNLYLYSHPAADHFWKAYLPHSKLFTEIFGSGHKINLLHHYFSKNKIVSPALLHRLAKEFPQLLILTIRVNHAFLNEEHYHSLRFLLQSNDRYIQLHAGIFLELRDWEKDLRHKLVVATTGLTKYSLETILQQASIWLEKTKLKSLQFGLEPQLYVFHIFLEFFLSSRSAKTPVPEVEAIEPGEDLENTMLLARNYHQFLVTRLHPYCFDLRLDAVENSDRLMKTHGEDLERNLYDKQLKALEQSTINITKKTLQNFASHFGLGNSEKLPFSTTSLINALLKFQRLSYRNPLISLSEPEFESLLKKCLGKDSGKQTIKILSQAFCKEFDKPEFNPFRPAINLAEKPFIKVDGKYFGFRKILSSKTLPLSIISRLPDKNNAWRKAVEKNETDLMEAMLAAKFRKTGFKKVICSKKYPHGDFDLLIYEGSALLIIELKRSKLRLFPEEKWDSLRNNLNNASLQLEKSEKYIMKYFDAFKNEICPELKIRQKSPNELIVRSLIVSTSLEYDGTLVGHQHLKTNLFKLNKILDDKIHHGNIETLLKKLRPQNFDL